MCKVAYATIDVRRRWVDRVAELGKLRRAYYYSGRWISIGGSERGSYGQE